MNILKKEKPDVVVSFGGYISLPICLAARLKSIPIVIHEQTQGAGLANKYVGKIANAVCISFPTSKKYFPPSKTVLTGLPLRPEVTQVIKKFDIPGNKPLLYVTGGSTGSHAINTLIQDLLEALLDSYSIIHQTGESEYKDFEKLEEIRNSLPESLQKQYIIRKYIYPDEIGWILKHAEVIVGRAGINTVNEIVTLHKKALLIPLPHGQKGEQKANAELVEQAGLGYYIDQDLLTPELFINTLQKIEDLTVPAASSVDIMKPTEEIIKVIQNTQRIRELR
jgi:UDP-N-acetylglucosamine--N-acetylmuramyl-(pentapeptide) pyrophosphoryl-undecaprenol N-acetylglucosamine transferase